MAFTNHEIEHMTQDDFKKRIEELLARREQCQNLLNKFNADLLIVTGAIEENQNWLNRLMHEESLAKIEKEKEMARRTQKAKATKAKKKSQTSEVTPIGNAKSSESKAA